MREKGQGQGRRFGAIFLGGGVQGLGLMLGAGLPSLKQQPSSALGCTAPPPPSPAPVGQGVEQRSPPLHPGPPRRPALPLAPPLWPGRAPPAVRRQAVPEGQGWAGLLCVRSPPRPAPQLLGPRPGPRRGAGLHGSKGLPLLLLTPLTLQVATQLNLALHGRGGGDRVRLGWKRAGWGGVVGGRRRVVGRAATEVCLCTA